MRVRFLSRFSLPSPSRFAAATVVTVVTMVTVATVVTVSFVAPAAAADSPGMQALQRFFSEVASLEARFEQVVLDENLNPIDTGRGVLRIQRPGRFRWDYAPPAAQVIVGDGARVWLYDVELAQVTVRSQARALGRSPAIWLAGGDADLEDAYRIEDLGAHGRIDWLNLIPRDAESEFSSVRVGFEAQKLHRIELIDSLEQRTRIRFFDLRENAAVDDSLFQFTPPAGVDVIDQTE
ncbi:MAG: outer membrane lipoprotein chaperone LolA [Gammaproteobacteria bacterium]|nr:outer membrane lipoprotein chaperone LolA [Gammaproteobacteria bacterium]